MNKILSRHSAGFIAFYCCLCSYPLAASELIQTTSPEAIYWSGNAAYEHAIIRVAHPNSMVTDHELENGLSISLEELSQGKLLNAGRDVIDPTILEDGSYNYEIRFLPNHSHRTRDDETDYIEQTTSVSTMPRHSGSFTIRLGYIEAD